MRTVAVVGASLAGLYAARELRAQGYDGRLVIIGAEPHPPYDRPPLSKDFLANEGSLAHKGSLADNNSLAYEGSLANRDCFAHEESLAHAGFLADAGPPAYAHEAITAPPGEAAPGGTNLGGAARGSACRDEARPGKPNLGAPHPAAPGQNPPHPAASGLDEATTDGSLLTLADPEEIAELAADWLLGVRATRLDPRGRTVHLDDGRAVVTDGVVVATGASARRLPGPRLAGVHTLRTLDDARALRAELNRGPRSVVVIGGGFIGAETASSCAALGHDVTVVEAAPLPLIPQLGPDMAAFCAGLHRRGGVRLLTGTGVTRLRHTAAGGSAGSHGTVGSRATAGSHGATVPPGAVGPRGGVGLRAAGSSGGAARSGGRTRPERVTAVELTDGRLLRADVVVVGIGATPNSGWLADGVLADRDGVHCDAGCVTSLPQVVAVGDVARVGGVRAEHWTSATEQPRVAVRNLLAGRTVETFSALPYFWSDQYGSRIQFAGHRPADATVRIEEGSVDSGSFLALYEQAGRLRAALAVDRPRPFMKVRRQLRTQGPETGPRPRPSGAERATGATAVP
ncbi:hypothetical protein GPA10_21855 [Streptomyces sp. p1417]|uniref:Uncharacterized protein n=1 Tax=Streptomyces typhae TaxID=2681492 RepID=A0A6L6X0L6_9ACTN|nr:FAD-dependent oxidoreductase [Streptomyces typhae]MVO87335.1 hypothetical protein [Streptomyces typhae]